MSRGPDKWVQRILLALLLLVPLLPNPGWFTNFDIGKWTLLTAGMLIALSIVLGRALRSKAAVRITLPEHLSVLAVLVIAGLALGRRAPDASATLVGLARIGTLAAFAILASRYLWAGERAERAFQTVLVAGAAAALVGIGGQFVGTWGASSTFGNPSFAAEFAAPAICLAVAVFLLGRRVFALATGIPLLVLMVLAKSRADWVGLAAGLLTLGLVQVLAKLKRRPPAFVPALVILGAAAALPYAIDVLPVPLLGRSDTVKVRSLARASTWDMALDHPWSGVGLEGFMAYYPKYRNPEEVRISLHREVTFPHNLPLRVLAETGVFGLLFLLGFLWVSLKSGFRTIYSHPEDGIAFGALGGLTAIVVSAQLSAPLRHPGSALLFFLLASLLVARRPGRYVADLKARYRRSLPVIVLFVPVLTGAVLLGPELVADWHLASAKAREIASGGGMDEEVADRLERSVAARPTLEALRQLAFYRTMTNEPERSLALLTDKLLPLSPWDEKGRIERARALLATGRPDEARKTLDRLAAERPGDDVVLHLRARTRWIQGDGTGALVDIIKALSLAPIGAVARPARWAGTLPDPEKDQVIAAAMRISDADLERALAILEPIDDARAHYHRVILLARKGDLDGAMDLLRSIHIILDRDFLREDPRLDPLRLREDFKRLLR